MARINGRRRGAARPLVRGRAEAQSGLAMRSVLLVVAAAAAAAAYPGVPAHPGPPPGDDAPHGGLIQYRYSTPEGAVREEAVRLRRVGGQTVPQVRGRVRWTSPEGRAFELRYEADENGYRVHPQLQGQRPAGEEGHWPSPPGPHRPGVAAPAPARAPQSPQRSLALDDAMTPPPDVDWQRVRH